MGKDLEKSLYKTSEDFEGYLLSSFSDNTDGPNVQVMEKNKKYDLNEIATDNSIVFVAKGFMQKDKPIKTETNTDNNTESGVAKPTETPTESDIIKPAEPNNVSKPSDNKDSIKPVEPPTETDKFEIGV